MDQFDEVSLHTPFLELMQYTDSDWQLLEPADWSDALIAPSTCTFTDTFPPLEAPSGISADEQPWSMIDLRTRIHISNVATRTSGELVSRVACIPYEKQTTTCGFCGLALLKKTLNRHVQTKHVGTPSLQCQICDQLFSRPDVLKRHQKLHCTRESDLECMYCGKTIGSRSFRAHLNTAGCVTAQMACQSSKEAAAAATSEQAAEIETISRFGIDGNLDVLTLCNYLHGVVFRAYPLEDPQSYHGLLAIRETANFQESRILGLRALALHSMRQSLIKSGSDARNFLTAHLLWNIDLGLYGVRSDKTEVHRRYLDCVAPETMCSSDTLAPWWDQVKFYHAAAGPAPYAALARLPVSLCLSINRDHANNTSPKRGGWRKSVAIARKPDSQRSKKLRLCWRARLLHDTCQVARITADGDNDRTSPESIARRMCQWCNRDHNLD